jgi:citrate/tricarballylate utilization protein
MQVNACRYCEGFCAVFPAMTQRLEFGKADINYLANLCHNCGACLHACQYAPPHEFAINVPKAMAEVRLKPINTTRSPRPLAPLSSGRRHRDAGAGRRSDPVLLLAMGLKARYFIRRWPAISTIFPHNLLAWMFGSVFILAIGC